MVNLTPRVATVKCVFFYAQISANVLFRIKLYLFIYYSVYTLF